VGLVDRLLRITQARIELFLASVENPELILPRLVEELRARCRDATLAESKARTAFVAAQSRLDQSTGRSLRLKQGAELALRQSDEALAREAITAQIREEARVEEHVRAVELAERALREARDARLQLEGELASLDGRKDEILRRVKNLRSQKKLTQIGMESGSLLDQVARIEAQLDEQEAILEIRRSSGYSRSSSIDEKLRLLEHHAVVEERLSLIRARVRERNAGNQEGNLNDR